MNIENLKNMPVVGQPPAVERATEVSYMTQEEYDTQLAALQATAQAAQIAFIESAMLGGPAMAEAQEAKNAADAAVAEFQNDLDSGTIIIGEAPAELGPIAMPRGTAVELIAQYVNGSNTQIKSTQNAAVLANEALDFEQHDAFSSTEKQNYADVDTNVSAKGGEIIEKIENDKSAQTTAANLLIENTDETVNSIVEFKDKLVEDAEAVNNALAQATAELTKKRDDFRTKFGNKDDFEAILGAVPVFAGGVA
jgi:hypothetical protein